jgi:hypothetical protein
MSRGLDHRVVVAAFFTATGLVMFVGTLAGALAAGALFGLGGVVLVGAAGLGLTGYRALALASDPRFAQKALAAAGLDGGGGVSASARLEVLRKFGKLPPAYSERVKLLEDLGNQVHDSLAEGGGELLEEQVRALAPGCREALDQAVRLAAEGARREAAGENTESVLVKLDRIIEILETVREDLGKMETGATALPEGDVVLRLEDLSEEVKLLRESVEELD